MSKGLVTLVGGSGFVGRYAARAFVSAGYRVRVACRRPHIAGDVRLAGPPGWVDLVQANVRDLPSLKRACEGADIVVNLVGILTEHGKQTFPYAQSRGAKNVAEAAKACGVERFIQVSAIGADADSRSEYARSKAGGETAVREIYPDAVILRPSIVFGPEDGFFNRFAALATSPAMSVLPFLPAMGGGKTRFQPIYAGDVADAIVAAAQHADAPGKTFELGGPQTYSFNELYDFIFKTIDVRRFKLPLPFFAAKPMGLAFGTAFRWIAPLRWVLGEPPITGGQVEMLKRDNVVAPGALTLADLGVTELESIEAIVPTYLWRFRDYGQFHEKTEA
ncbi:MAG: complex I NDUFA9 subunit family protein [Pseudomonadota bacterium]